jgi:hypothetical protein
VKQLLIDLRNKVWALAKENAKLRDSISEARAQIDQQLVQRAHLEQMLVQIVEESDLIGAQLVQRAHLRALLLEVPILCRKFRQI